MGELVQKWVVGVMSAVTVAAVVGLFALFGRVAALEQKHGREWDLEKTLILVEIGKVDTRVSANEANIEELENEVRGLQP